ncbi:MAG: hypothetical protein RR578_01715 [Bacilli bacterium]
MYQIMKVKYVIIDRITSKVLYITTDIIDSNNIDSIGKKGLELQQKFKNALALIEVSKKSYK